jgi:excisionase family DNA binding protein
MSTKTTIEITGPVTASSVAQTLRELGMLKDEPAVQAAPAGPAGSDKLLTPAEVATMFRVDPKTVTRWAKDGKLTSIRTLGGHRRYREIEVRALMGESTVERRVPAPMALEAVA